MKYLLGIDFGGGSSKATLLGESGLIAAEHSEEYRTFYPSLGAYEQEPEDWIKALVADIRAILGKGFSPRDIAAIAMDSATHTAVLCDSDCRPLRRAIHWTDSRARSEAKELRDNFGERIFDITFHKPDTIWTLPQLLWVRHNEPEIFCRIQKIFFEKDYIRYLLTGVWCTDEIEAQGSMLFDCRHFCWDETLCEICSLPISALPPVVRMTRSP